MPDPLRQEISDALLRPLDEKVFEDCAWALLSRIYPNLMPMPGGDDQGYDGAAISIYGPSLPLICTVSPYPNARSNLRMSLKRVRQSGSTATRALFATPRPLTNPQRRKLEEIAGTVGFETVTLFEHDWFREQLWRDDSWRLDLLGITGRPSALSPIPKGVRIGGPTKLVGRDDLLGQLLTLKGDVVLSGQPGVGKTALLENLCAQDWGYFLVDSDREAIANGVRRLNPLRIIVDDAHFSPDALAELQHLRAELQIPFEIVATSWPARADTVSGQLGNAQLVEIPLLSLDDIAAIVRSVGIQGPPELIQRIVNQARGRAGLATTLAQLCISGRALDVAQGDALLKDTVSRYQALLGRNNALLLSVISLAGDRGVDENTLQSVLRLNRLDLTELLQGLAQGGVVEEIAGKDTEWPRLIVQPEALRYASVYDQFFKATGAPPVWSIVEAFPDPTCAALPLIGAVHRGAAINRDRLRKLISQGPNERVVSAYARLGRNEAKFCLAATPQYSRQIAVEVLEFATDLAVPILLDMAATDTRALDIIPDYLRGQIQDVMSTSQNVIERRRAVVGSVIDWLAESGNVEIALIAFKSALNVGWEDIRPEPGSGHTITIRHGLLNLDALNAIGDLWGEILEAVKPHKILNFSSLLDALSNLCHQGYAGTRPSKAWIATSHKIASRVITKLASQYSDRPGLIHSLKGLAMAAGVRVALPKVDDFDKFFPHDRFTKSYDAEKHKRLQERQRRAVRRLAVEWLRQPAFDVAKTLAKLEREAGAAGVRWPRLTPYVAGILATSSAEPQTYLVELVKEEAPGDVIEPFVWAVARSKPECWSSILAELLSDDRYKQIVVRVGLVEDVGPELREHTIALCDSRAATWLEFDPAPLSEEVLLRLLGHSQRSVVTAVIKRLGLYVANELTAAVRPAWEEAVVDQKDVDNMVATILAQNPRLLIMWLQNYMVRASAPIYYWELIPDELLRAIAALKPEDRMSLLQFLAEQPLPGAIGEFFPRLIGSDADSISLVFQDPRFERYRPALLYGVPNDAWLARAILAMDGGMGPDEIVTSCQRGYGGVILVGSESDQYRSYLTAF